MLRLGQMRHILNAWIGSTTLVHNECDLICDWKERYNLSPRMKLARLPGPAQIFGFQTASEEILKNLASGIAAAIYIHDAIIIILFN